MSTRGGKVTQWTANPRIPVRFWASTPIFAACFFAGQALAMDDESILVPKESLEAKIAPAIAPQGCALDFLFLVGAFSQAAHVCNGDWMERGAVTTVFKELNYCKGLTDTARDALLKMGADRFNEKEQKFGHDEVCKQFDSYMIEIETILNAPPTNDEE
jgi:hypothetical protein